jgi:stringent starvation protein B
MTQLLPPKKEVALALLERSNVDVYLDPRARGVVVPPQFRKEPRLILKIGLNMPVPIPDLRVDEDSMSCTLSFSRSPFYCVVPWSSVFAMVGEDGRGMVWPDDVPQELAVKAVEDKAPALREVPPPRSEAASSRPGTRARASKLAVDAPDSPAAAARGGARKRKKKDEEQPRPVLVAVPSPPPSSPRLTEAEAQREAGGVERGASPSRGERAERGEHAERAERDERGPRSSPAAASRDSLSGIPTARIPARIPAGSAGSPPLQRRPEGARPKRELPPYLRVVK